MRVLYMKEHHFCSTASASCAQRSCFARLSTFVGCNFVVLPCRLTYCWRWDSSCLSISDWPHKGVWWLNLIFAHKLTFWSNPMFWLHPTLNNFPRHLQEGTVARFFAIWLHHFLTFDFLPSFIPECYNFLLSWDSARQWSQPVNTFEVMNSAVISMYSMFLIISPA
jgi:hypothetical protein